MGLLLSHKCTLSIYPDMVKISRVVPHGKNGGGKREEVEGFSRESRKRLFELLHCLTYERLTFITLTYPAEFPHDWHEYKAHLRNFRARLERKFGKLRVVWRLEYQKRGAPHYHLLLLDPPFIPVTWACESWHQVIKSDDLMHLKIGVDLKQVDMEKGGAMVSHYIGKYMSKEEEEVDDTDRGKTGRHWGRWNIEAQSPVTFELEVGEAERAAVVLFSCRGSADTWRPSDYCNSTVLGDCMGSRSFGDFATRLVVEGEYTSRGRRGKAGV